nr:hypothetical protein [Tanacetum cinerariifolium]
MTPTTLSSGLVPNPPSSTPYVLPTKNDWDILFQPMFDEFFNPPPSVSPVPAAVARRPIDLIGSPVSTFVELDAPSTKEEEGYWIIKQDNAKQAARDEKLVPSVDRVKIDNNNLRINPSATQRDKTYQVALDIIKNTSFYNVFLISVDVQRVANLEDFQYQIDYHKSKVRRREIIPYPRFTKAIIHYFMTKHKSISTRQGALYHTVDDEMLDRLKFIKKGDMLQLYGKPIPDTWITNEIKKSKEYNMYFKYSTVLIPPKKGRDEFDDNDEEEDDKSIDIEKTNDERTDTNDEDMVMGKAEKIVEQMADEEHKSDEEQKREEKDADEQIVVPISTPQKDRASILQSTSSHPFSSNFGN